MIKKSKYPLLNFFFLVLKYANTLKEWKYLFYFFMPATGYFDLAL